jgi:hypothetical protein
LGSGCEALPQTQPGEEEQGQEAVEGEGAGHGLTDYSVFL